jgi:hypothetical protein
MISFFSIEEEDFWEALDIQMDLMSPLGTVELYREPTMENLLKAAYMPATAAAGAYWATLFNTMPGQGYSMIRGMAHTADTLAHVAKGSVTAARKFIPAVTAYTLVYFAARAAIGTYHDIAGTSILPAFYVDVF